MKKILITVMIFLFTATTVTTYAQIFKEQDSSSYTTVSGNSSSTYEVDDNQGGFFRSSTADPPGDRPGNGEGIGQQAPIGEGLQILVAFCMFFGGIKYYSRNRKKQ